MRLKALIIQSIALFFLVLLMASCDKSNPINHPAQPSTAAAHDYYKINPGSYWVYQIYSIDTLNNATLISGLDSDYICCDTLINSNTYHIMKGNWFNILQTKYYQDSSGWLVDNKGNKYCNFNASTSLMPASTDISNLFTSSSAMTSGTSVITVPAGTYTCVDARTTVLGIPPCTSFQHVRYYDRYYCDGKGLVQESTFYWASPNHLERRLLRSVLH